jgi:hypothetical protein
MLPSILNKKSRSDNIECEAMVHVPGREDLTAIIGERTGH